MAPEMRSEDWKKIRVEAHAQIRSMQFRLEAQIARAARRDEFAKAALIGLCALHRGESNLVKVESLASGAVAIADRIIEELDKPTAYQPAVEPKP